MKKYLLVLIILLIIICTGISTPSHARTFESAEKLYSSKCAVSSPVNIFLVSVEDFRKRGWDLEWSYILSGEILRIDNKDSSEVLINVTYDIIAQVLITLLIVSVLSLTISKKKESYFKKKVAFIYLPLFFFQIYLCTQVKYYSFSGLIGYFLVLMFDVAIRNKKSRDQEANGNKLKKKLSGWQRIGIVISALWIIFIICIGLVTFSKAKPRPYTTYGQSYKDARQYYIFSKNLFTLWYCVADDSGRWEDRRSIYQCNLEGNYYNVSYYVYENDQWWTSTAKIKKRMYFNGFGIAIIYPILLLWFVPYLFIWLVVPTLKFLVKWIGSGFKEEQVLDEPIPPAGDIDANTN